MPPDRPWLSASPTPQHLACLSLCRSPTPAPGGLSCRASTIAPPRILFPPASAPIPSRTPAPKPPEDAVGSGYADTINSYPAQTASHTDLRDYTVRLMNWRERHCLCRRCDSQGKGSNGDRPDHFFSSLFGATQILLRQEEESKRYRAHMGAQ
jgi:hypothetical protein